MGIADIAFFCCRLWVGAVEGGVIDRESAALPTAVSAASSAEEGSFLLLLQPGKGWRFLLPLPIVFPVSQLVSWALS